MILIYGIKPNPIFLAQTAPNLEKFSIYLSHSGKLIIQNNFLAPTDSDYFFFPVKRKNNVVGHSKLVASSN